jgi:hypothetical protein
MSFCAVVLSSAVGAQTTDANPAHTPDVMLDNHRPLIGKKEKAPTSRSVIGKVVNDASQPVDGALVTLTDLKTNEKTTFITKKDGSYRFDDLSFTEDYQIQARYKDLASDQRKLSQYDRNATVVRILQLGPSTASATAASETKEAKKDASAAKR